MGILAQELRLGNIVDTVNHGNGITSPNKQPMWIQAIELHSIELCNVKDSIHDTRRFLRKSLNDIIPIPLTEEWLLKFGETYGTEWHFNGITFEQFEDGLFYSGGEGIKLSMKAIDYVHQLQNLFFSLCGKELEIV